VTQQGAPAGPEDERELVAALPRGDERAFTALVDHYHGALVRVAMIWVRDRAVAEEVAQETWLGVLKGIDRFEGRSSLKTWLFRILANRAKTRGVQEHRTVPVAELGTDGGADDDGTPSVDPLRFLPDGAWASPPRRWEDDPEAALRSKEARRIAEEAIAKLPDRQRAVITLRDLEGLDSDVVRNVLDLTETNQRVLLHRARAKVRQSLEDWIDA
jgi:RNA polymerase sigma-70 factor (ECF subfamily)